MEHLARKTPAKQVKVLPEEITKAQDALVQCYRKNQDRSLDCWAEVQEFKELVQKAQNVGRFSSYYWIVLCLPCMLFQVIHLSTC